MQAATFKSIMASFPSGVSVITALDQAGAPRGLTCSSLCSVSLDPPMLLVCVSKDSETLQALFARRLFVVNFLKDDAAQIARLFASKSSDKFAQLRWRPSVRAAGAPILRDEIVAHAECRVVESINAGDHHVFLAVAEDGESYPARLPLVYLRKRFESLSQHTGSQ